MSGLTRLKIEGFKSIRSAELELRPLNVLIGANGSGKSNLVSFFRLLRAVGEGGLQLHVGKAGGADALLHYGSKVTPEMRCKLEWMVGNATFGYDLALLPTSSGNFATGREDSSFQAVGQPAMEYSFGRGRVESGFRGYWEYEVPSEIEFVQSLLSDPRCYHFNDTTATSPMLQQVYIHDNTELRGDAGNLAAYLYMLRETQEPYYRRILDTIRLAAPFLDDFVIEPLELNPNNVILNWRDRARGETFGPHQLSDGTLRFIALTTLLLQPEDRLPKLIVIDEPELGLHPFALNVLAGLLRSASHDAQIIVATQSARLVDEFQPEDIIVADHHDGASEFRRLNSDDLSVWLEDYSVGTLWEMNVFGGRPSR